MDAIERYRKKKGLHRKVRLDSLIFRSDFHKCRKIFRAVFARLLLIGHTVVGIWLISKLDDSYLAFYIPCGLLFLTEGVTILYFRTGCEWKRFCTCFLVYLLIIVPVMWILRLDQIAQSTQLPTNNGTSPHQPVTTQSTIEHTMDPKSLLQIAQSTKERLILALNENAPSYLEQSMMFLIIICRWMLPRGRINRNVISQLLMMYSATSADILDFSEIMNQDQIKQSEIFKYVVLGVWSWSLVQFVIVMTNSIQFRRRQCETGSQASRGDDDTSEKLSILLIFVMQDGPFLGTRVYAIFWLRALDYQIIFFSLKNMLTIILAMYRLLVLYGCVSREGDDLVRQSEIQRSIDPLENKDDIAFIEEVTKKHKKKNKKDKKDKKSKF